MTATTEIARPGLYGTIAAARAYIESLVDAGVSCPCCEQRVQLYRRRLNPAAVRALIMFRRTYGTDFGHAPSTAGIPALGGEWARLALWGLIEEATEVRPDGGRAGWWRLTEVGSRFIDRQFRVPKYALTYKRSCRGLTGPLVSIDSAIGRGFDLQELLDAGRQQTL